MKHLSSGYPEKLGDISVKYLPAINVKDFLTSNGFAQLTSANMEEAALALTSDLFRIEAFQ
jgi:hypothetical protein